jgi:hypothetical protein
MRTKSTRRRAAKSETADNRTRNLLIGGGALLGVAALLSLLFLNLREPGALEGLKRFAGLSRGHDETISYEGQELPPVGGIHSGVWQNCGIYDEPVEASHAVHSMEHGAVWVTYHPDLPADDVSRLQDLARGQNFVLLSPYPGLNSPVVLTAWGIQLELDDASDSRIADFIERYQVGPQTPEIGASCVNGTGTPLQ